MTAHERGSSDYTLERWILFLLGLLFLLPFVAQGQELDEAALLLRNGNQYTPAVALKSEVEITVTGPIVRTRVRQFFKNTSGMCSEGIYVFPLPETSAVDSLKMTIGSRIIVGEIREREQAAREYEQARSEGRKAALVEQHRPNMFTTSVASLMPDEEATIEIEYQESARYENGEYRLRFPMVVAQRYEPESNGARVSSPAPRAGGIAPVSLTVDLNSGYSLRNIKSNQRIRKQTLGQRAYRVDLDADAAGRDFELAWEPDLGSKPEATLLTETAGGETYALLLVTPPHGSPVRVPRETVFIIDSSGSMEGESMEQAREALILALADLRPSDTFNVIDFDSDARRLFQRSRPADRQTVAEAIEFVRGLRADGGTEMLKAIRLALPSEAVIPGTVRQVIFMTDGQVGNEQELFSYIHSTLGDSRLFTVGIGSAPNSHFMRNAARFGRGTFTYIGDLDAVKDRMGELFEKLSSPVLTGVEVKVSDPRAEIWPRRVPDVYRGEPLVVAVRLSDPRARVEMTGQIGGEPWTYSVIPNREDGEGSPAQVQGGSLASLGMTPGERGIGKLWARQKIESLTDGISEGSDPATVRSEVIAVALRHHLVSQFTSLIAVDKTPQGLTNGSCKSIAESAADDDEHPPGELPQTATPAALLIIAGVSLVVLAITASKFLV
jgi:Ca-activated chloride channel family protein